MLNVNSIDTTTWRVKAAYGHVIVPGLGERYVGNRNIRFCTPKLREHEYEILITELKRTNFPHVDKVDELLKTFKGRALINAWIITKVNGTISQYSSFYRLYNKLHSLCNYELSELIKIYESIH